MKHEHAEVIKAWADGIECEYYFCNELSQGWFPITDLRDFYYQESVRIKPEPKPKEYYVEDTFDIQYLYLYNDSKNGIMRFRPTLLIEPLDWVYMGKVRLEK